MFIMHQKLYRCNQIGEIFPKKGGKREEEWGNGNHDLVKKLKIYESLHWIKIMSNIGIWSIWNALNGFGFFGIKSQLRLPACVNARALFSGHQ